MLEILLRRDTILQQAFPTNLSQLCYAAEMSFLLWQDGDAEFQPTR